MYNCRNRKTLKRGCKGNCGIAECQEKPPNKLDRLADCRHLTECRYLKGMTNEHGGGGGGGGFKITVNCCKAIVGRIKSNVCAIERTSKR